MSTLETDKTHGLPPQELTSPATSPWRSQMESLPAVARPPQLPTQPHAPAPHATLGQYVEVVFKYWRSIVATTILALLACWAALVVWPRTYESEAKLLFKVGRESVSLDPTATTGQTLMLQKTQDEEINSSLEMLSSRQIAANVVEQVGAEAILAGALPSAGEAETMTARQQVGRVRDRVAALLDAAAVATGLRDEISTRERAIRRVQELVAISAPKQSTVASVYAQAGTPEMAQALAAAVVDAYLQQHLHVSKTAGSFEFFQNQSIEAEEKLSASIARKSRFLGDHNLVSIDVRRNLLESQIELVEGDLIRAAGELEQAEAEVGDLLTQLNMAADEIVAEKSQLSDATWSGMRQRVYELELEEQNLAAKYTEENQKLVRVRKQLEGAREILAKLQSERINESTTPNPEKRRMQEQLQQLQTRVAGLRSLIETKQQQRRSLDQSVAQLLQQEQQLARMDREIQVQEASLLLLSDKLEEARVIEELQHEQISNVSVFQPATFVEKPVSPKKRLYLAGALLLGLAGGTALAFAREGSDRTLRTPAHVESYLRTPIVAQVPIVRGLTHRKRKPTPGQQLVRARCESIVTDLLLATAAGPHRERTGVTVGIIGCERGCGASTIATELAIAASAESGLRVTLIDADVRERCIAHAFELPGGPGLAELLSGEASVAECVHRDDRFGLDVIASAAPETTGRLRFDSIEVQTMLHKIQEENDLVIVDMPPADRPDFTLAIARHLDHMLVVVAAEQTDQQAAERVVTRLAGSGAAVLGVILNKTRTYVPRWFS